MQKQVAEVIFQLFSEEMAMESKQRVVRYEEIKLQKFCRRFGGDLIEACHYLKGAYKKDGGDSLPRPVVAGQEEIVFNWKRVGLDWT